MIVKEKIIFWPLLAVFIGVLVFGLFSRGDTEEATEELSAEIEQAMKKSVSKERSDEPGWDIDKVVAKDNIGNYKTLLGRSPFFRVRSKVKPVKETIIPVKKIEKKPVFKYKGKVMMGEKVMVIIEDQGTGKSSFVKEGDSIGSFLVMSIDEEEVVLKKKGGEEVVLKAVKKKNKE